MSRKMLQVPVATFLLLLLLQSATASPAAAAAAAPAASPDASTISFPMERQIDASLKNAKQIESRVLPELDGLQRNQEDEKWQQVVRFIDDGFPVLELYAYKFKRDIPYTLIVPKIDVRTIEKPRLKEFMLEHLVPGKLFDSYSGVANSKEEEESYGNGNGHKIVFRKLEKSHNNVWLLNGQQILYKLRINENLMAIGIDGYLGDRKSPYSKRNIQETNNRYNDPQPLEQPNITNAHAKVEPIIKESKASPLMSFLANMKTGTKVFQHFLSKSNLTRTMDDNAYTVLIPSDNAFQRWHPIDWGFYPFSVPEFTESVLLNHFLPMQRPLRLSDVRNMDEVVVHTMGGDDVVFHGQPTPTVNNVSIMSDFTLSNGNQVFIISEVLFVTEAVVSKLHQMHKDKETPPLLAFPWFGAQFLSHSFLALERDPRFTQITRYLNNAEIAPHISGANYTFFVPEDRAFEKLGFDRLSDEVMVSL
ncbi:Hypothetical predicted protein [Drosophila guanche]|uniref:FAS1 domain-containing protein n=1 Tax=Drosophila guanche TaxID=7266 RepID=A0A3B0K8Y7_DROGU|nr:Hypothetical predicted protein [Drosophila guanche]